MFDAYVEAYTRELVDVSVDTDDQIFSQPTVSTEIPARKPLKVFTGM